MIPMPTIEGEIALIEAFADTTVIGITINHEGLGDDEISAVIDEYELTFSLPATDPLTRPQDRLVDMVLQAYPTLGMLQASPASSASPMPAPEPSSPFGSALC